MMLYLSSRLLRKDMQKTYVAKPAEIKRQCFVIDAKNKILGRVAAKAASLLRGKHKAIFTPHVDTGDMVVITNAKDVRVTGMKLKDKIYVRHTGYPGGKRVVTLQEMLDRAPTQVLELAVFRMIASGPLGNRIRAKLKVYADDKHPHQSQNPIAVEI